MYPGYSLSAVLVSPPGLVPGLSPGKAPPVLTSPGGLSAPGVGLKGLLKSSGLLKVGLFAKPVANALKLPAPPGNGVLLFTSAPPGPGGKGGLVSLKSLPLPAPRRAPGGPRTLPASGPLLAKGALGLLGAKAPASLLSTLSMKHPGKVEVTSKNRRQRCFQRKKKKNSFLLI